MASRRGTWAVDDQLVAPLEDIAERHRAVGADDGGVGRHLCQWQPASRGDRVALAGVCLLALAQLEELSLEVVGVGDGRGWRGHGSSSVVLAALLRRSHRKLLDSVSRESGSTRFPSGSATNATS